MYNLKTSRKKEQLIQIILDNIHCTELKNLIDIPQTTGIYVISEKGKQAICDDEYVLYAHRYKFDEFTVYSLNQLMKGDTKNYRKYIWRIFLQKEKQFIENHNYGLHSNLKLHMADFLSEEGQYLEALKMIADVIYIELSNLYNNAGVYPGSNSEYFIYDNTYYISDDPVSSGILGKLYEYQEKLKLDNEQLACILREQFNSLHLPFHVFTKEECINITLCLLNEQNEEIKNIYQTAIDRLKTKYPEIIFEQ